ncbi:MAG: ethanolamine permease [Pelatocladus maniniholoensis HA4357-MV3]|uniref:Ethanolamine permease n=1 Tax=Pelatocladus maniniholoensis HA4357-MV3 TaxID=1117104 RepID=A0A9E3HCG7_9NOST|nr:ethanolamine permease [Pelatocladus maniniholoensis HA4357-MV3]BAZ69289.1 ethanolamine transporter [Fischerella sp. NIES-4106]
MKYNREKYLSRSKLPKSKSIFNYENVDDKYLQQRQLRRSANWLLLWALGVGSVISGDFSGWNFGLGAGGFGGLAIATYLMAVMYICMVYSIAELSAALPHAGGFFSFTRKAFGRLGGFICGVTIMIEYVLAPAVVVFFIGAYLNTLFPYVPVPVWWLLFYAIFVCINIRGTGLTLKAGFVITAIAATVLIIFFIAAIFSGQFQRELLLNIPPEPGNLSLLPKGWIGVFQALPYAMWFYLAIEHLPMAAEETHDTSRDIPKALVWSMITLLLLSLFVLVLNTGVGGGAAKISLSAAPLADGIKAIFGETKVAATLILLALTGLIASFHTAIYSYGRVLFSLSRAGYIPRWISITSKTHTPALAMILGAVVGLVCTATIQFAGKMIGAMLLNMTVFGAVISYVMVMSSYIKLKLTYPDLPRPYQSPLGIGGAIVGCVLAIIALFACFSDPGYRPGVWGVAIFLGLMILYFLFYSRKKLVAKAPEEEDAMLMKALREIEQP